MAAKLSELRGRVYDALAEFPSEGFFTTIEIDRAINEGMLAVAMALRPLEGEAGLPFSVGQESAPKPPDVIHIFEAHTDQTVLKPVTLMHLANLDPAWRSRPNGVPEYWYEFANNIYVWPRPASPTTVTIMYSKRPQKLANDDDLSPYDEELDNLVVLYAVWSAALKDASSQEMINRANAYMQKYNAMLQMLATMRARDMNRPVGKIRVDRSVAS